MSLPGHRSSVAWRQIRAPNIRDRHTGRHAADIIPPSMLWLFLLTPSCFLFQSDPDRACRAHLKTSQPLAGWLARSCGWACSYCGSVAPCGCRSTTARGGGGAPRRPVHFRSTDLFHKNPPRLLFRCVGSTDPHAEHPAGACTARVPV